MNPEQEPLSDKDKQQCKLEDVVEEMPEEKREKAKELIEIAHNAIEKNYNEVNRLFYEYIEKLKKLIQNNPIAIDNTKKS